jgi:hypothetical protein
MRMHPKRQYQFTYTWNIDVLGKDEFENFKARKK